MPYTYPILLYYAPYLLCIAVHLATLQLVVLVARYSKWSSQSDRFNLKVLIFDKCCKGVFP
ncbi:hypothetical protein [Nostoc sp.]|uniref:hypothetical protein n=1 Tax=Nostoc sp. TaxID=1180 RepID=UPI002FF4C193